MYISVDYIKQIGESTSVDSLKQLEKYVDIDIANIGKDSDVIKKMKADMYGISYEEIGEKQLAGFMDMKTKIHNRISELSK